MTERPDEPDGAATEGVDRPEDAPHDSTGLELARSLAQELRGRPSNPRARSRSTRPKRGATELSGAHPDARDPALIGQEVDKLVAQSGWEKDVAVHGVFGRWPAIVGSEVAAHCTPEAYTEGRLRVRTDSTAWATQLRLLAPTVVRRMNEELGHGTVLVIDVIGPDAPSWTKGRRAVRDGRGPRDTYG